MIKRISLIFTALCLCLIAVAQTPSGYYSSAIGLSSATLKSTLHNIIDDHDVISYNGLWTAFEKTDVRADGKVWDMYSDCSFNFGSKQCGNYSNICDCYNREHSFPKSWFSEGKPMYSDLFHLYPTDGQVNGRRSNYPFGECKNGTVYGKGRLGNSTYPGYAGTVFEPDDEYKGDFARSYFYMLTRYMDVCSSWSTPMMSGGSFTPWACSMLLKWNEEDPVSDKEIKRNNVVYSDFQHNRNPFIDYPELADKVFGSDKTPFKGEVDSFLEDFESATKDVYKDGVVELETGEWRFNGAVICRLNDAYNQDLKIGEHAVRLRLTDGSSGSTGDNGYIEMVTPKTNGVGVISLYHATYGKANVDANSTWRLQISKNGEAFENIGDEITSSNELTKIVFTPMIEGDVRVRISKTDGTKARLNIDNIEMTDYDGAEPILSVTPASIDFGSVMVGDVANAKNVTVLGVDLSSNIGYELTGADANCFNVEKVSGWNGLTGGGLAITFLPTEVKECRGNLIVKSIGVKDVNVIITGAGYRPAVPTISTDVVDGGVGFNTIVNNMVSKRINVRGYNLKQDIALSVYGSEYFEVTPKSIEKNVAMSSEGVNVTVSYRPDEVGTHAGSLKLSSEGVNPIVIPLSGVSSIEPSNMIVDGGFERWDLSELAYWKVILQAGSALTKESTIKTEGDYAVCMNYGDGSGTSSLSLKEGISVEAGSVYLLSFDYYYGSTTTGNGARIWGVWKDAAGKEIKETNLKPNGYLDKSEKEVWKQFSILATAPADAVKLELEIRWYKASKLYVDNMKMICAETGVLPTLEIASDEFTGTVENNKRLQVGITGSKLTPNSKLSIDISGEYFTLDDTSIAVNADGEIDDAIVVNYSPLTLGIHNATLTITGGGLLSTVTGVIVANSVRPTPPVASGATDITSESFTANWGADPLGRYLLTVNDDNSVIISDLEVLDTRYSVTGLVNDRTYYYSVKTATPNYSSLRSNIITVTTKNTSVDDIDNDVITMCYNEGILSIVFDGEFMRHVYVCDVNGRIVVNETIETSRYDKELRLSKGMYAVRISRNGNVFTNKIIIK